jgi:uncharacterized protein (DUF433 family)
MADPDTIWRHIVIVAGAGGPKAMIAGHRVRVDDVVVWHEKLGMSPDAIVDAIPTITLADVHAALACWDNRENLDRQMEKNSAEADENRRLIDDGRLARKLLQRLG